MRKGLILLIAICLMVFQSGLFAAEKGDITCLKGFVLGYSDLYSKNDVMKMTFRNDDNLNGGLKSYKKAILLSALIPGAGEIYNGSNIKGIIFMGIEVLSWSVYFSSNSKGEDIKREFHLYSDTNWSADKYSHYLDVYRQQYGYDPPNLTHTLPRDTETNEIIKTQQYYEMTGKYDQFVCGWDDCDEWNGDSEHRLLYEDKRYQHNKYLKRAINATSIILLNRVISLVDTIWGVKLHNDKVRNENAVNIIPIEYNDEIIPSLSLKFNW